MRELTYYVACSVDGFIAHADGSHDGFSQNGEYLADLFSSFPETVPSHLRDVMKVRSENKQFDSVLMGRKTYEIGLREGVTSPYSHMKQYLFSRTIQGNLDERVQLVSENAVELVGTLKKQTGKGIWLCGGANLAATLFENSLIDQLILKINPFLMGAGTPLFSEVIQQTALELTNSKIYENGVVMLYYKVK